MSGLEVVGAVAAVISAFHGGAELVAHIKKKHRKRKSEQLFQEKQLQDSLQTGETQVGQRYAADCNELGEIVRRGDGIARDRLLHIAIVMQAEIIRSLQLAVKYEDAIVNLTVLHEASITNRRETIAALDDMKQRILIAMPLDRTFVSGDMDSRLGYSFSPVPPPSAHLETIPDDYIPSAVTIPAAGLQDTKHGLANYFARQRHSGHSPALSIDHRAASIASTTPSTSTGYFNSPVGHPFQGQHPTAPPRGSIMKDIDEMISSYQGLRVDHARAGVPSSVDRSNRNTLDILNGSNSHRATQVLHREAIQMLRDLPACPEDHPTSPQYPAFNPNIFIETHPAFWPTGNSSSANHAHDRRWSTASSVYSDTIPSLYNEPNAPSSPPSVSEFSPRTPSVSSIPPPPIRKDSIYAAQADTARMQMAPQMPYDPSSYNNLFAAPAPLANALHRGSAASTGPPPAAAIRPNQPKERSVSIISGVSNSSGSSTESSASAVSFIRSNTIQGPKPGQQDMMNGRPCKDNNYWGFCKGAWTIREDFRKGFETYTIPSGIHNTIQKWRCKHCSFTGGTYHRTIPGKKKKEVVVDPTIHNSSVGIRYRWIFLAKCHTKKRTLDNGTRAASIVEDTNYGCLICSAEGHVTGVYGNAETLMNHIFMDHARTMEDRTKEKTRCIIGREARPEEDFDINIPFVDPSRLGSSSSS